MNQLEHLTETVNIIAQTKDFLRQSSNQLIDLNLNELSQTPNKKIKKLRTDVMQCLIQILELEEILATEKTALEKKTEKVKSPILERKEKTSEDYNCWYFLLGS
jgi:hypothetical protein